MPEEKKTTEKGEMKPAEKQLEVKAAKEDTVSVRDLQIEESPAKTAATEAEELPDSIKKLLEKKKSEKVESKKKKRKKKIAKRVTVGRAYISATYNNTIITLTDQEGNVISWASAGIAGFKGPKKATPYAASIITRIAVEKAKEVGLKEVSAYVKGVGTGRESAIRALNASGLSVTYIKDITPIPHNGCRPKKPRRV